MTAEDEALKIYRRLQSKAALQFLKGEITYDAYVKLEQEAAEKAADIIEKGS